MKRIIFILTTLLASVTMTAAPALRKTLTGKSGTLALPSDFVDD